MATMAKYPATNKSDNKVRSNIFGRSIEFEISNTAVAYAIFFLRLVMGWTFFQAGITKVLSGEWTAAGYLNNLPAGNPFNDFFVSMAGNPTIDFLNQWGLTLVGIGLFFGIFTRWSAFWGAVIMLFYWASSLSGGLGEFLPIAHGWVIDDHMVYALILFGLGALGAGRILGVDAWLEKTSFVQNNQWLKYLLG